ncbi:hypothetical protein [Algoriphagus sediminis]|uniref:DedA family protein n=1 Tax=Algoriphagus sediminis TaxID=3057113 RepID=A0ABT7YF05_9BACT|nr:hypothetical protein [Algoriphagus sediminis]MDN3205105.1 hypothetical protein [Algoriphagus sediminis]
MSESFLTFLGIYFLCWFKFISGPLLGSLAGYGVGKTILVTVTGTMSSVFVFTFVGQYLKKLWNHYFPKPKFTKRNRDIIKIWNKFGQLGIAFLTPLILTPIGGTLILVSFGTKRRRIYFHMLWSSTMWSTIFAFTIDNILAIPFFENLLLQGIG